jgi:polysaccharide pyruvyl transferase WcaK-like protein
MKVLLFANVGGSPEGFYHVGDEAMFFETYRIYKKTLPKAKLTVLSSYPSHGHLDVNELVNLQWPDDHQKSRLYFFKLIAKTLVWKIVKISLFTSEELAFIKLIRDQDRIHFTGGGNLTSLFAHWLYYCFFIIFLGWLFKREVILTSQTIGPFKKIDYLSVFLFLNMPEVIFLREETHGKNVLRKYGIVLPKVDGMIDAALTLSKTSKYKLPPKKVSLRVGVSIHSWKEYSQKIADTTFNILRELSKTTKLEVVFIPHLLDKTHREGWDIDFMNKLSDRLPAGVKKTSFTYSQLTKDSSEPASTIKYLSSAVDLMVASRYHGLVFALAESVPSLALTTGEYYNLKNDKLLEQFYGEKREKNVLYLGCDNEFEEDFGKVKAVIGNLTREKAYLKSRNVSIRKSKLASNLQQVVLHGR